MLESLHIKNVALIDECELSLGEHFNVLTGETGAGKSIIIDAFSFVLGARADKSLIRYGEKEAAVEAVFDVSKSPIVQEKMQDYGFEADDKLIIYRTMSETKSDIRVNGKAITLSMLKEITSLLVDILGQHEHQSLLNPRTHRILLDKYDEEHIHPVLTEVSRLFFEYRGYDKKLSEYGDEADRARKIDILKFQIDEIAAADLKEGEEEELLVKRDKFRNGEKIVTAVSGAYQAIDGDDSSFSVDSALSTAMSLLSNVSSVDPSLESLWTRLDSTRIELRDIADTLSDYADNFDFDNATAEYVEKRVDLIRTLKRKYGGDISSILNSYDAFVEEYTLLNDADVEISRLEKAKNQVYSQLLNKATELSMLRHKAAERLKSEIENELSELGMGGTVFEVKFSDDLPEKLLSEDGFDVVEFMISPNVGEPLRELSRIISGGEMSRFMLAVKVITARLEGIGTLVFDEVDAGISGHIGQVVAEKLNKISRTHQVIAITHLPQVAAMSDAHYLISKSTVSGKTSTSILQLDEEGVVGEIARLAAGDGEKYGDLHARALRTKALEQKQ